MWTSRMTPIPDPIPSSLDEIAARVRRSSNFRFAWQWFDLERSTRALPADALGVLRRLVAEPECHAFLRSSFDPMYEADFRIGSLHEHVRFVEDTADFEGTLARAAADRLGAYSRDLIEAGAADVEQVRAAFAVVAPYTAFRLESGEVPGCAVCAMHNGHHLFTNWFYGVAWDWTYCVLPRGAAVAWVGMLTDTD